MTTPVHSSGWVAIWCSFSHRSKARKESPYEGFVLRIPDWSAIDSVHHILGSNFTNNSRHCPLLHNLKPWEEENRQWIFFEPSMDTIYLMYYVRLFLIVQVVTWQFFGFSEQMCFLHNNIVTRLMLTDEPFLWCENLYRCKILEFFGHKFNDFSPKRKLKIRLRKVKKRI